MATASNKRKTLHNYFAPAIDSASKEADDFTCRELPIPGLTLILNFISRDEEAVLLTFLETQQWRTDLSRRCIHYGGTFCLMPSRKASSDERKLIESTILEADPLPEELGFVVEKMIKYGLYDNQTRPAFCIVNEYTGTQGISAHVENYRFASPVCGLTLQNGDLMRFHELACASDASKFARYGWGSENELAARDPAK